MENERKSLRWGVMLIAWAAVLRLLQGGLPEMILRAVTGEQAVAALFYLESGRVVRPGPGETAPVATTPPGTQPEEKQALLTAGDAQLVSLRNNTDLEPDILELMLEAEFPSLAGSLPTVLIVHSHGSESYLAQAGYTESSPYRTHDREHNMISIGEALADKLRSQGIGVIHDTTMHDVPDYNGAYASSRAAIRKYLEAYPSIRLVLDLHRDASSDYVNQLTTHATVDEEDSAQLMLVIGTSHDGWQRNMSCAVQLHALLEKTWPGLCRAIDFRTGRFNQDLGPVTMLVEVGAAGDTRQEALVAVDALADAIVALSWESATEDSTR